MSEGWTSPDWTDLVDAGYSFLPIQYTGAFEFYCNTTGALLGLIVPVPNGQWLGIRSPMELEQFNTPAAAGNYLIRMETDDSRLIATYQRVTAYQAT